MINHTFVICAYKESRYLEECVKSVLSQSVKSNVLIKKKKKNDYILQIAQKYNISVIVSENESDISRDWNFAINAAQTDYVTIAHQDDIYSKSYLENIIKQLKKRKDIIICCTDYFERKIKTL